MSGDTFDFAQGTRETLRGTLHDTAATTGDVLTVQTGGAIAAAPGGGSMPVLGYVGTSDPEAPVNAIVTVDGAANTTGTFKLTVRGQTTAPIAFDATTDEIVAALAALSTVGDGNSVSVFDSGGTGPNDTSYIAFVGALAAESVDPPTVSDDTTDNGITTDTYTEGAPGTPAGATRNGVLYFNTATNVPFVLVQLAPENWAWMPTNIPVLPLDMQGDTHPDFLSEFTFFKNGILQIENGRLLIYAEHGADGPALYVRLNDGEGGVAAAWGIREGGWESLQGLAAPADGDVANGEQLQWYDDTTGKPVTRFKQKDDAGTLTSGVKLASGGNQDTVGAAGGADALPATPSQYIKIRDVNGDLYVVPAYAAS